MILPIERNLLRKISEMLKARWQNTTMKYYHEFVNKAIKLISDVLSDYDIRFGKKFES